MRRQTRLLERSGTSDDFWRSQATLRCCCCYCCFPATLRKRLDESKARFASCTFFWMATAPCPYFKKGTLPAQSFTFFNNISSPLALHSVADDTILDRLA
ncbi:unnamed protein product, partial [Polarella glacialis]